MRRPRRQLRRWLLAFALCLSSSVASADPGDDSACPRAVQLEGPLRLVVPLSQALRERGIASQTLPGCTALVARLEERGPLVAITVVEELRRGERTVTDLGTALAVIESFARSDISAPLLAAPFGPPSPTTAPPRPTPPAKPTAAPRFSVESLVEAAVDTKGQPWFGADLGACARVGPLCLGMRIRFSADLSAVHQDGLIEQRFASDLYLTADLPLRLSRFTLSPGIGLGAGWMRHRVNGRSGTPPAGGTETGADNDADDYFGEAVVSDGGMRVEARLVTGYRLRAGVAVEFGVALAAAVFDSPNVALVVAKDKAEPMTSTPWGVLRFGLGLSWSGP